MPDKILVCPGIAARKTKKPDKRERPSGKSSGNKAGGKTGPGDGTSSPKRTIHANNVAHGWRHGQFQANEASTVEESVSAPIVVRVGFGKIVAMQGEV